MTASPSLTPQASPNGNTPRKSRLIRHSLGDLLDMDIPPREPLLGGWLVARHQCMVYAPTGLGKSLLTASVALAVAGGGTVFGWQAPEPRRVLIVDGEMDYADIQERLRSLLGTVEGVDEAAALANLSVVARHAQKPGVEFPDLADPEEGHEALLQIVDEIEPALVILDNFSTLANVQDENDAHAFNPVIELLVKLRSRGMAVILVHHSRKSGGSYRGSSKIAATFESIIELRPREDVGPDETGFELRWEKFRSSPENRGGSLRAKLVAEGEVLGWECESGRDEALYGLVSALRSLQFPYQNALAEHLSLTKVQVSRMKREAIHAGLIAEREWTECLQEARVLAMEGGGEDDALSE